MLTACADSNCRVYDLVPPTVPNTVGSMVTFRCAGVTPALGVMVIPGSPQPLPPAMQAWKGTPLPAELTTSTSWVRAPLVQKLPRKTRLLDELVRRGARSKAAIGNTVTPLSEIAYKTLSSA